MNIPFKLSLLGLDSRQALVLGNNTSRVFYSERFRDSLVVSVPHLGHGGQFLGERGDSGITLGQLGADGDILIGII